jgi:nucleotide-binding universal stress UspA family protein
MKRMLVGFDASSTAVCAARWSKALADEIGVTLMAALAFDGAPSDVPTPLAADIEGGFERLRIDQWDLLVGGRTPQMVVGEGTPGPVLRRLALHYEADTLVVGSARACGSVTSWLGSTATWLAHHLTIPLLVVPGGWSRAVPERLVVGLDGSPPSDAACRWAVDLASAVGGRMDLVHVDHSPAELVLRSDPKSWYRKAEARLASWTEPVIERAPELPIETRLLVSPRPADAILAHGDEIDAGLVVVGAHGLGTVTGQRLGGVAMGVLHRSDRPVALIPVP